MHFLLVGDGGLRPKAEKDIAEEGAPERCHFTGLVEASEVGGYLEACDILVSPHSRSPDGRKFFGSPTKLFEYMAANKAIIASALDQIGEVLENGKTALLVEPDDCASLA